MSNINNTTKVHFAPDQDYIWNIKGLEQWDKCQKLEISGLDISDEIVEVHFSLEEFQGNAKRMLGVVKDGVIHADIPAFVLEGPGYCNGIYLAYAWIYVSDDESAETIRKMEFTIKARPKPEEYVTPDELSFLQQLEQAIKNKITTPTSAKVGQLLSVKKVDENGKPTEFDVVDQSKGAEVTVDNALSEESTNPVQNQVVTKEVKALQERNAKLEDTVEKLQIKTTTEPSPFHHITDSANMKVVDFGMSGKTEQDTKEGRNWLSEKFSDYESGLYSATDGTKTDNVNAVRLKELIPVSNSVIYNYVESPVEGVAFLVRGYGENKEFLYNLGKLASGSTKFIQNDTKYLSISLINDDITMTLSDWKETFENGLKLYICSSTDNTEYETYTGRMPSPNPEHEEEIKNAGVYNEETGRYGIGCKVVNKNLWDKEYASDESNWRCIAGGIYPSIPIFVGKGNTVTISYKQSLEGGLGFFFLISKDGNNKNPYHWMYHSTSTSLIKNQRTLVAENDYIYVCYYANNGVTFNTFMQYIGNDLQIEISDTQTDYTTHASQQFTLTSPVPLTKWDYLTKRDGVWGWSIWSEKFIPTSDMDVLKPSYKDDTSSIIGYSVPNAVQTLVDNGNTYCNRLRVTGNVTVGEGIYRIYNNFLQLRLAYPEGITKDSTFDEVEVAYKKLFGEKEFVFFYPTAAEQAFHPLPDEEQELLKNLETYYGVTNLYNDQGCPIWLTYITDPKLYTDKKIAEQIAQTQALILEN